MIRLVARVTFLLSLWCSFAAHADSGMVGDVPVIDKLDTSALATGRHQFYFNAGRGATGVPSLVPVIVLKGVKPGKQLLLTAAVHGDELNGIRVIHRLMSMVSPEKLSGTIVAVPGVNQPGMEAHSRYFGVRGGDPNRAFPGTEKRGDAEARFAYHLWHGLLLPGTDLVVDLHTQTTGTSYPLFVFADFRNDIVREMAFSLMPDMIKNDPGEDGTLETSMVRKGIPAVTFEIGGPKQFQAGLIDKALNGLENFLNAQGFLAEGENRAAPTPVVGSSFTNVYAGEGGLAVIEVDLKDHVKKGDPIATLYDPFGRPLRHHYAPVSGAVVAVATDPVRDAGAMLVRILH
ncbi:succinylglutamate desuccinylase/aspartoacylase family protein [Kordiimonas aestuarii]|uniref:succinylglutamate desuccinylase/aspartoacylase family protein n=1 Tax=Kordiimonas aestuarii TaxID=1005925 RepID=UPI0021CDF22D|nr:succinylglutamate desuccinylase/aspartoacylase family protein [Kordiimonas aestuarii]